MIFKAHVIDEFTIALFAVIPTIAFDARLHGLTALTTMSTASVRIRVVVCLVTVVTVVIALKERRNRRDQVEVTFVQVPESKSYSILFLSEHVQLQKSPYTYKSP